MTLKLKLSLVITGLLALTVVLLSAMLLSQQQRTLTAEMVKESINQSAALMGKEHAFRYHFMVHQFMHGTKTAMDALAERRGLGSMRKLIAARDRGVAR